MKQAVLSEALDRMDLAGLLAHISHMRVAVLGDLCLDVYWHADMRQSELSRETPHYPLPVISERFSLGGAGNVCANAAALGAQVTALGVVGCDWRADVLARCCAQQDICADKLIRDPERFTNAYCKPIRHGICDVVYEDPRLDFCTLAPIGEQTEQRLLDALDDLQADVLCVCDQLRFGCITPRVREKILALAESGLRVIADSRDRIGLYRGVWIKPNELEGYAALYGNLPSQTLTLHECCACAEALAEQTCSTVFMTLGAQGCVCAGCGETTHVTAAKPPEKIDFVGAGDTMLAALSTALATGAEAEQAMTFANLCASVTIAKLGVTGTASANEVLDAARRVCRAR